MNSTGKSVQKTQGVQDAFRGKTSQVQRNEGARVVIKKKKKKLHKHVQIKPITRGWFFSSFL